MGWFAKPLPWLSKDMRTLPLPLSSKKVLPYFDTSTVLGSGVEAPTDGAALPGALIVNRGGVLLLFAVLPCSFTLWGNKYARETKRCACKLSTQERRENRRDGSFRRFPAKNIVAKLVFVRMLLASVLQAAIKEL